MRLEEWDKRISPKLQDIEYCSSSIARNARHLQVAAHLLPARPEWLTKARDHLDAAERELRFALATVQAAKQRYDNSVPVILEAAE